MERKLVIFDDDQDILSICAYILEEQGWQVHVFTDCIDIVDRITTIAPAVILMDNWIPDAGGVAATRQLKAVDKLKHIPVIYFSANSDIEDLATSAGAESFLAKPFDLDELTRVIDSVLPASDQHG
jgi:two-component system cell cycle response regulator DivK